MQSLLIHNYSLPKLLKTAIIWISIFEICDFIPYAELAINKTVDKNRM